MALGLGLGLGLGRQSGAFNPASLFGASDEGSFIDWTDDSTVFQERRVASTLAGENDVVGAIISKAQGGLSALGSELWDASVAPTSINQDGTSDGAYDNGRFTCSGGSTVNFRPQFNWSSIVAADKSYCVEMTFSGDLPDLLQIVLGGRVLVVSGAGTITSHFLETTNADFEVRTDGLTAYDFTAEFSIREIPGKHWTAPTNAARIVRRRTAGGLWYLERDTTDDMLTTSLELNGGTWSIGHGFVPDGSDFVLLHNAGSSPRMGIGQSGNTTVVGAGQAGVTLNSVYWDNTLSNAATRADQYTLAQSASRVVMEMDVATGWPDPAVGKYSSNSTPGDLYGGLLLINRSLTAAERTKWDDWLKSKVPA